jgi:hypothetical protein
MLTLRNLLDRARRDDGGNLFLVLLFTIFMLGIVIVLTATVIASAKKTNFANNFTVARSWSDAAVNQALFLLNGQADIDQFTEANPAERCTDLDGSRYVCWRWYPEAIPANAQYPTQYRIVAESWVQSDPTPTEDGYNSSVVHRRVNGIVTAITTTPNGATATDGGQINYTLSPVSAFSNAVYGNTSVYLSDGVVVTSYDSATGTLNPTGNGTVASDGLITFANASDADRVRLYSGATSDFADRCQGDACARSLTVEDQGISTANSLTFVNDKITATCPQSDPVTLTGGTVSGVCTSGDLHITGDVTVTATDEANPVLMYVGGDLIIDEGVSVNTPTNGTPRPGLLYIYVAGETVSLAASDNTNDPTQLTAAVFAPQAACGSSPTRGHVHVNGSLVCDTVTAQGSTWLLRYDDAITQNITPLNSTGTPGAPRVWQIRSITEQ